MLLGFAGAFRRSELVGIQVDNLQFELDGLRVHLLRSKTDQEGRGQSAGDRVSAADAADNFKNRRRVRGEFVKDFFAFMVIPPSLLLKSSRVWL